MKKFEYKTFNRRVKDFELNELGKIGWELISHSVAVGLYEFTQYYIFKRELKE